MKKLMIVAALAVCSSAAFAQADVVKAILKANSYDEAKALIDANQSSLTDEQKAKAYNKLVDLSVATFSDQQGEQLKARMQQTDFDPTTMYEATYNAIADAIECDAYDNMANDKGKVAPKFHKTNRDRLSTLRVELINAGQYYGTNDDAAGALKNYSMYVDSWNASLFADLPDRTDPYLGEVARVSAVYCYNTNDLDGANKYCDIALTDTTSYKEALGLKMFLMQKSLVTHEDSLKCLAEFEKLYAGDKSDDIFTNLANMYGDLGDTEKQLAFIDSHIAIAPNSFNAWALKGQTLMNQSQWDDAITCLKKANEIDPSRSIVCTYIGFCINSQAAGLATYEEQKEQLKESVVYLEKAREMDPYCDESNWTYPLYQCYYTLYGADDSRTQELEAKLR